MIKKCAKLLLLAASLAGVGLFSGCVTESRDVYGATTVNMAGFVTITESDYTSPSPTTLRVKSTELGVRDYYSGNQARFLWGLITYTDYE